MIGVIFILAGPQVLRKPTDQRVLTNIQFCVDVSGSMSVGRRYEMARDAVGEFVDSREGDAFGLTIFGSYPIRWVPLTQDLDAIRNALPFADPQRQPMHMGGTRIGAALRFCLGNMVTEAEDGDRMIILVSDGVSSDLSAIRVPPSPSPTNSTPRTSRSTTCTSATVRCRRWCRIWPARPAARHSSRRIRKGLERVFEQIARLRPDRFAPGGTVPMDFFLPFAVLGLVGLGGHLVGLCWGRYTPW